MTKLNKKLEALLFGERGSRGESLTEVLVAIVVGALAILMLYTAITTSVSIAKSSRDNMDQYFEVNNKVVTKTGDTIPNGSAVLKDKNGDPVSLINSVGSTSVTFYKSTWNESNTIVLYES